MALALSLPESQWKPPILTITYGIVVFSIVFQGLTLERVARAVLPADALQSELDSAKRFCHASRLVG